MTLIFKNELLPKGDGKFQKGWKGGPGRPSRVKEAARLAIASEVVTDQDWRALVEKALDDAINGADGATRDRGRRFLADYLLGRPINRVALASDEPQDDKPDLSGLSDDELRAIALNEPKIS
jgi:hypothetical protein